jgi:hypothetical protein
LKKEVTKEKGGGQGGCRRHIAALGFLSFSPSSPWNIFASSSRKRGSDGKSEKRRARSDERRHVYWKLRSTTLISLTLNSDSGSKTTSRQKPFLAPPSSFRELFRRRGADVGAGAAREGGKKRKKRMRRRRGGAEKERWIMYSRGWRKVREIGI